MNKLKIYRRAQWYLDWIREHSPILYEQEKDKIYVCLGEFAHAPGHHLMCEFGTWGLSGMHEFDSFEELDAHPDDYEMFVDTDGDE